jgi:hypothetical protein
MLCEAALLPAASSGASSLFDDSESESESSDLDASLSTMKLYCCDDVYGNGND